MAPRDTANGPDWEEITKVSQFRERVAEPFGVIVIQDSAGDQPIAHHPHCAFIKEDIFVSGIIDDARHDGHYYWARDSRIAADQLGARRCKHPGDKLAAG